MHRSCIRQLALGALMLGLVWALVSLPVFAANVTIVHWQHFHEGRSKALEELIKVFEQENPGITVKADFPPYEQYTDKLLAALATGSGPDVFQVPMEMAEQLLYSRFLTAVPKSVLTTDQIEAQYLDWTVARFKRNGLYWGLPTDVQHLVMYINDDLARASGLDPTKPPKTWQELLEQARKATKRDAQGNILQAGLDTRYRWAVYTSLLYSYMDGPVVSAEDRKANYDSPQGLAAWRMAEQLARGPQAVDSPRFMTGQRKFEQSKAVFYINHPVARSVIATMTPNLKYTVAPVPTVEGKPVTAPGHHWAYVVSSTTKNAEAAWKWVHFLASEKAIRKWMEVAGDLPSLKSMASDPSLFKTPNERVIMASIPLVRPVESIGFATDQIRNDLWDAIALTDTPVDQLVKQYIGRENALIKQILR
ncbi:extracellular solute-binding protein [Carboxydochorda subterranea]|uniref:Extracellular solute-binding protein n=1 Tax=Carboxydichorda subterranea TaxID=3109565 RepID=A0ABZ1BUK7_9FIRM|nr:extracellular solute-binding protein [Limnochorda sp. L945t]WRP16216.1 extracellular solute-binding protein [Limnochorda sp. L945t]